MRNVFGALALAVAAFVTPTAALAHHNLSHSLPTGKPSDERLASGTIDIRTQAIQFASGQRGATVRISERRASAEAGKGEQKAAVDDCHNPFDGKARPR